MVSSCKHPTPHTDWAAHTVHQMLLIARQVHAGHQKGQWLRVKSGEGDVDVLDTTINCAQAD